MFGVAFVILFFLSYHFLLGFLSRYAFKWRGHNALCVFGTLWCHLLASFSGDSADIFEVTCFFLWSLIAQSISLFFRFSLSQFVLHCIGFLLLVLRAIYIGMYAGGHLRNISVASLVLIELPWYAFLILPCWCMILTFWRSFLYVSYVSILVMSFSFAYLGILTKEKYQHYESLFKLAE